MSWVVTAVVAGAVTARAQYVAGKAQEIELEVAAEEERVSAESRELRRRQELNKVLAMNAVSLADSGMAGEGTPASIALESAKQISASEGVESLSTRLKQAQLRRQGKNAASAGKMAAASTLLNAGVKAASLGGGG